MKYISVFILVIGFITGTSKAAEIGITGKEPPKSVLGAPLYPGTVFVRTMSSLDPFYESVFYISPDPVVDVKNFFIRELPGIHVVQYIDMDEWVWTFLLKAWIPFPDKPTRDDLPLLDVSPNIQVRKYQRDLYDSLIELFETKPEAKKELEALKTGKTIIRYTYRKIEEDIGFTKIIGTWKNTDRDLPDYYGSIYTFKPDSTYTIALTPDNIAFIVKKLSSSKAFQDKFPQEIQTYIEKRNPEKGVFSIMRNNIDMATELPVIGDKLKSGLADVGSFSFSMQLINTPRLTFIRQ